MTDAVLVVQKSHSQSKIWSKILASQNIIAITESPQVDLRTLLKQTEQAQSMFPNAIILEMSLEQLNPYEFCRWVQKHYPSLKVILTAQERTDVSEIERKWAKNQGAYELLPGFDYGNLTSSLTQAIQSVLLSLGISHWEQEAFVPVVEEIITEFGLIREENTFIQESETLIQNTVAETPPKETPTKPRGVKLKPKVKRFRGLTY